MRSCVLPILVLLLAQPPLAAEEALLARLALLVTGDDAQTVTPVLSDERWIDDLLDWDPERDRPELEELLGVPISGELLRQAVELPLDGGELLAGVDYEGRWFEVQSVVRPLENDEFVSDARIRLDGEIVAAPRVLGKLGERTIVSTRDAKGFLFFVLEVDRVLQTEADAKAETWGWEGVESVDFDRVKPPRALPGREQPQYTEEARKAGTQGKVVLRTLIGETGKIEEMQVLRGLPNGLSKSAMDTIRGWRFEPATIDGQPVPVIYHLTINFLLANQEENEDAKEGPGSP
jgi:TonB family protein